MLFVGGHGHLREGDDLIEVGAEAAGGDGVSQEVGSSGANFGFGGEFLRPCLRRRSKRLGCWRCGRKGWGRRR